MKKSLISGVILSAWLWSVPLQAATVSLVPQTPTVAEGGTLLVDLFMDATDSPGDKPGSYAGSVSVTFDDTLIDFSGFSFEPPVIQGSPAVTDLGDTVNLGFTNAFGGAADSGLIGTFSFTALPGSNGNTANFGISDPNPFGSYFNFGDVTVGFTPEFEGASAQVVPIPAAAWLFGSALFGLGGMARKKFASRI